MPEKYVQINIGSSHLEDDDWLKFKDDAYDALEQSTRSEFPTIEVHSGQGEWAGFPEESAHISTVADVDTYALRVKLRQLAVKYSQDTIALIVGSDLVVGSDPL